MRYLVPSMSGFGQFPAKMFLRMMVFGCLCSSAIGYHSKRQLGTFHWYDQLVLPTGTSVHQQQLQDRAAVVFAPQYTQPDNYRRAAPEQAIEHRLACFIVQMSGKLVPTVARLYPVFIQFLSPEAAHVKHSPHMEPQYQLALEPLPDYQPEDNPEYRNTDGQLKNSTQASNDTEPMEFGNKVSTRKPSSPHTKRLFTFKSPPAASATDE